MQTMLLSTTFLIVTLNIAVAADYYMDVPAEPNSGYIAQRHQGNVWQPRIDDRTVQPGAYRTRNGTVVTGAAQNPGCGGGVGQYQCPDAIYIPDDQRLRPCTFLTGAGCVVQ